MALGLVAPALPAVAYIFVVDPLLFVTPRCAEGLAAAAVLPTAHALIADDPPDRQRGRAYGFFSACFNFGFLPGPALRADCSSAARSAGGSWAGPPRGSPPRAPRAGGRSGQ
jgi:MFS family permease